MLRHTLLIRLKPGVTDEQAEAFITAIKAVPFPGRTNQVAARDLGLRPGNMDLVVSSDFPDEATFHAWGQDPGHEKVRQELLAPIAERIERCFYRL